MNDYIYTDSIGRSLAVTPQKRPNGEAVTYISANDPGVIVGAGDAPAVALAILEAAGHGGSEAAGFVRGQVEALAKKAEREAEDAKVRGWLCAVWPTAYADDFDVEPWHRSLYRASSKYHEES